MRARPVVDHDRSRLSVRAIDIDDA